MKLCFCFTYAKKKVSNPITSVELYLGNNFYKAVLSVLTEIMYFYSVDLCQLDTHVYNHYCCWYEVTVMDSTIGLNYRTIGTCTSSFLYTVYTFLGFQFLIHLGQYPGWLVTMPPMLVNKPLNFL